MRTTLTLDDDVTALLKRVLGKRRTRLKDVVNEALRAGLARMDAPRKRTRRYRTPGWHGGRCLIGSIDCVSEALAIAEGENFR